MMTLREFKTWAFTRVASIPKSLSGDALVLENIKALQDIMLKLKDETDPEQESPADIIRRLTAPPARVRFDGRPVMGQTRYIEGPWGPEQPL